MSDSPVSFEFDTGKVIESLKKKSDDFMPRVQQAMYFGMQQFAGKIQSEQMSGRNGSVGLNVVTGNLRRSISVNTLDWGSNNPGVTMRIGAKYAIVHETGIQNVPRHKVSAHSRSRGGATSMIKAHFRKAHVKKYPKRLQVRSTWNSSGTALVLKQIMRVIKETLKK